MHLVLRSISLVLIGLLPGALITPAGAAQTVSGTTRNVKASVKAYPALGKSTLSTTQIASMFPMNPPSDTRLQVLRDQGPEFKLWLNRLDVNWRAAEKDKNLIFRWDTKAGNVKSAIWQVAIHRYSPDSKHWETPSGMILSGKLTETPSANNTLKFNVDFSKFAPKPGAIKQILPVNRKKVDFYIRPTGRSRTPGAENRLTKRNARTSAVNKTPGLSIAKQKPHPPTAMHITYYVRIIPIDGNGKRAGVPSEAVEISYGDPPPQPYVDMSYMSQPSGAYLDPSIPPNAPELNHPDVKISSYTPIQKDQPGKSYHYIVTAQSPSFFGMLKPGTKLDFTPHKDDKSWLESVGDFFSGVVSFAESAVNWVSTAYNDIKSYAVSWAPAELQGVLSAGLDIGLAALGVPPSIPNFDELTSMGSDYLIKAASDYAGVDPALTKMAVGEFMKATSSQASCGGNPSVWLKPDPAYYYRPAYITLQVKNNTDIPTDQATMNIAAEPVGDKDAEEHGDTVFYTASAFIPTLQPGENVSVPVFFEECMPLRWDDHDLQAGMHRFWNRYNAYPVKFSVSTYNGGKFKNRWKSHETLQLEHAYYGYTGK